MQGWFSLGAFSKILKASDITETRLMEKAKLPGFKAIPLGLKVSIDMTNTFETNISKNVVGLLKGKTKPDEYIIYSAHWDHLGIGMPVEGDSIYNGALDNASGTASLLAIANKMSQQQLKPDRSIVFMAVTAEEQGLLGSAYYSRNPIYPPHKTIANLNMDSRNQDGKMRDFTVTGYGQSELDEIAAEEAEKQGRYVLKDQEPHKGYFFRSDHFNFAKIGIPALYAKGRYDHWEFGKEYAMNKNLEYRKNHYHRPSDHYYEDSWSMDGLIQDADIYYNIGWRLATSSDYPNWKTGSEFKAIRDASLLNKN
jgi:Zn-dependent M28 family amino/carboxypeptidase